MNYELAKKLKDAGFLQEGKGELHGFIDGIRVNEFINAKVIYIPTLSELIEACGERFEELVRTTDYDPKHKEPKWRAFMTQEAFEPINEKSNYPCVVECCGYELGDTPEIAVANLWLKLNE